jgi:hypothetical protein
MSKRNTGAAEAAITTNNEHFNGYALAFLCKAKEGGKFPNLDTAMGLYCEVLGTIQAHHAEPLKGDRAAEVLMDKAGMNEEQRRDIYQAVRAYLVGSEFDVDLSMNIALLKGRTKAKEAPAWTSVARVELQELVRRELEHLPATLESLEPKQRIAILCKLLPYALPRFNNVEGKEGRSNEWPAL